MRKSISGFTLVELLIAIVVIAILAAISVVAYSGVQERAKAMKANSAVAQYVKLIEMYRVDHGEFPSSDGPQGEYCLGEPEDYPADGNMPAGHCLYDVDYEPWRLEATSELAAALNQYGSLPQPPLDITELGTERWRGLRYRESVHLGRQFAEIQWVVKGANNDYCSVSDVISSPWIEGNTTWCGITLWGD